MKKLLLSSVVLANSLLAGNIVNLKDYNINKNDTSYYVKTIQKVDKVVGKNVYMDTKYECAKSEDFSYFDVYDKVNKKSNLSYEIFTNPNNNTVVEGFSKQYQGFKLVISMDNDYFKSIQVYSFRNINDCKAFIRQDKNYVSEETSLSNKKVYDVTPTFKLGKRYVMSNGEITGKIVKATTWDENEAVRELDYTDGTYRWDYEGTSENPDYDLVEEYNK